MNTHLLSNDTSQPGECAPAVHCGNKLYTVELATVASGRPHHFAGTVVGVSGDVVRLDGYDFVYDVSSGNFFRKPHRSERILRIDNGVALRVLPDTCDIDELRHERDGRKLIITDGKSFRFVDPRFSGR